jgi:hypothetical protein
MFPVAIYSDSLAIGLDSDGAPVAASGGPAIIATNWKRYELDGAQPFVLVPQEDVVAWI